MTHFILLRTGSNFKMNGRVCIYFRRITYWFAHNSSTDEQLNTTLSSNVTLEEFYFTLIRNIKMHDHFSYERNFKASVIQDARNPHRFLYLTEYDR